jgi:hypothetical protein
MKLALLTETGYIALVSVLTSAATLIVVALIGRRTRETEAAAQNDRDKLIENTTASDGHDTLGSSLGVIEERLMVGERRFDRIEVRLDEHSAFVKEREEAIRPLVEWVNQQMRKKQMKMKGDKSRK